jgi:adenylylsulfate kinase
LPASGKSTLVAALRSQLTSLGIDVAVLESDVLRHVFTPDAAYQAADRDLFYKQFAYVGALLTEHGVPVIFDATANLRRYRDEARRQMPQFFEVFVDCALATCMDRDPKGIYRKAREGGAGAVPGVQAVYEPPLAPEATVQSGQEPVEDSARRIIAKLREKGFISLEPRPTPAGPPGPPLV